MIKRKVEKTGWHHYRRIVYPAILVLVLITLAAMLAVPATAAAYESYISGYDAGKNIEGSQWLGQIFTAASDHSVTGVSLRLYRTEGYAANVTISIRSATYVAGGINSYVPTGSDLASVTFSGSILTTDPDGYLYPFTFGNPINVYTGGYYAIVVRAVLYTGAPILEL